MLSGVLCGQMCEDLFNRINDTPEVTFSVEVLKLMLRCLHDHLILFANRNFTQSVCRRYLYLS